MKYARTGLPGIMLLVTSASGLAGCQERGSNSELVVPNWAHTGNFSFSRWDGGPIEVEKGVLSGWPGFTVPDPQVTYATEHLYDLGTIEQINHARVNWISVTWSNGFSNQSEAAQQDLLTRYIKACHQQGIHVTAYVSIANIFWEDMFLNVPQSRDWVLKVNGEPVPYPAADYAAVGRVTRYMADLSLEAWQQYTLGRVIAAVNAGADAIVFDNSAPIYGRALLEKFTARALAELRKRNPQVLLMSNYPRDLMIAARAENAVTSELGWEPGVFDSEGPAPDQWNTRPYYLPVSKGLLVSNAGLLRSLWAVSQGVRPVAVEYGNRHSGNRFLNTLPPAHQKLALAECAAFHAANEQYHESTTLRDLLSGEQAATQNWDAVAQYNSFLQSQSEFYENPESLAGVAVIIDTNVSDIPFLNSLAARNLIYDVVFEEDVASENLARYSIVIAAPSVTARSGWKRYEDVLPAEFAAVEPASVTAPDSVIVNVNRQSQSNRTLVHLLNYADAPVFDIDLKVKGQFATARVLSPDFDSQAISTHSQGEFTLIRIPALQVYDLVVLEP